MSGKLEFFLTNLHHYTFYDIYVQACREIEGNDDLESSCSSTSIRTARTMHREGADDIKSVHITNQSLEIVSVTWREPEDPNGVIFSYTIEYKRLDNENVKYLLIFLSFFFDSLISVKSYTRVHHPQPFLEPKPNTHVKET